MVCAIEDYKDFYQNTFELVNVQPNEGIKSSIHYNSDTAKYLDCFTGHLNRYIRAYDMTDDDGIETFAKTDPSKFLRKEIINGREHRLVEISKLWLISS